jgi:hypothetical protein
MLTKTTYIKSAIIQVEGSMLIDTHTHTTYSDGLESAERLISGAASQGIEVLSITDHDCIMAYPKATYIAGGFGIHMVPGVEISTKNENGCNCIHIVGLGIKTGKEVSSVLDRIVKARDDSEIGFLNNLNDFLSKKYRGWIPTTGIKPSVFHNTRLNAISQGIHISEKEMMDYILNEELWVPIDFELTVQDAIGLIKDWGGVPVLAHPFDFSNDVNKVLKSFIEAGGEAIELCKYRYKVRSGILANVPAAELMMKEREMNLWTIRQAQKYGLKLTMASDHHDENRIMGMCPEDYGIDVMWLFDL